MKDYYHYKGRKHTYTYILLTLAIVMVGASIYRIIFLINKYKEVPEETSYKAEEVMEIINVENKDETNLILVNKENILEENYVPENLVDLKTAFISNGDLKVNKLAAEAAEALEKLFKAAAEDKIYLLGVSGYRAFDYQKQLFESEVEVFGNIQANRYVAKPGESEHQTGLAMDILSKDYEILDEGFKNTKAYKWLQDNCGNYGFIIRYPEDKEEITGYEFEPWHIRYVGVDAAKVIMKENITLEEYLKK